MIRIEIERKNVSFPNPYPCQSISIFFYILVVVRLKKIYKFDVGPFLIKRTVFVLIMKYLIKNQKFNFPDKICNICTKKMLRNKIVCFKKIYEFNFDHFLIKCTVFVIIVKNVIKNQKFYFLAKLYGVWKNFRNKSCTNFILNIF